MRLRALNKESEIMKATVMIKKEIEFKTVLIDIQPRHVGDSDDDDVPTSMPMLQGDNWTARVDIDTGVIRGWPQGKEARLQAKVCDQGSYYLYDEDGEEVARIEDNYIPNSLIPGKYGDYIDLKINADGVITNWPKNPSVSEFFDSEE